MDDPEFQLMQQVAQMQFAALPSAPVGTARSFFENTSRFLAEWSVEKKRRNSYKSGCCGFVFDGSTTGLGLLPGFVDQPYLKDEYPASLGGNIYITDSVLNRVQCHMLSLTDIASVIAELKGKNLSDKPLIIFDPETQRAFLFENGVTSKPSTLILRSPPRKPFDYQTFKEILESIYSDTLQFPAECPLLWSDPLNRVPCPATERVIQLHVCTILKYSAHMASREGGGWLVIRESEHNAGRTDIVLQMDTYCLVAAEIKVLRFCSFPKKGKKPKKITPKHNEWWANRGARQAARYQKNEKAKNGVLLIYDMRDSDQDIASAKSECTKLNVDYQRFYLNNKLP